MKKIKIIPVILAATVFWISGCSNFPFSGEGGTAKIKPEGENAARLQLIVPALSMIAGVPTDRSITINLLAEKDLEIFLEYGTVSGVYNLKTPSQISRGDAPLLFLLDGLKPDGRYFYRAGYRRPGESVYTKSSENSCVTQRPAGSTFVFGVQGDSHPDRPEKMFSSDLYKITMRNAVEARPDFYFTLGDDFSIEKLIEKNTVSPESVNRVYLNQRQFLEIVGSVAAVFLVNGNHEQAAKYLLDGSADNPAVLAAQARIKYFPLPLPGGFYSGDEEKVDNIGNLRDYYSFEWGDALFVVIDPYWHSDIAVDNPAGKIVSEQVKAARDLWQVTIGDEQYKWFKSTLENSQAKYKFVFEHHLLGTGRGGVENAGLFEWGGYNRAGVREFEKKRPGWEMPIHDLMVKNGVTIFFQGHDHLFVRQQLDGVVYQTVPVPADYSYSTFNAEYYKSGDILPNSGFLKVTVSPEQVKVDYIKSYLLKDETAKNINGGVAFSYVVK
jgi:hypothetical protein